MFNTAHRFNDRVILRLILYHVDIHEDKHVIRYTMLIDFLKIHDYEILSVLGVSLNRHFHIFSSNRIF